MDLNSNQETQNNTLALNQKINKLEDDLARIRAEFETALEEKQREIIKIREELNAPPWEHLKRTMKTLPEGFAKVASDTAKGIKNIILWPWNEDDEEGEDQ